jgi:YD repeat-containing protein
MGRSRTGIVVAALYACLCSQLAHADVTPQDEYSKRLKVSQTISPGGDTPFGERINLYTGELSFSQTDLVDEGIGPAIVVNRTTATSQQDKSLDPPAFGLWDLSIPRIETLVMAPGEVGEKWGSSANGYARCTEFAAPLAANDAWWHGMELVTEDGERRALLKRAAGYTRQPAMDVDGQAVVFTGITTDNWQIGCLDGTANGQVGEAFLAVSPKGIKYWLNYLVGRPAESVREMDPSGEWVTTRRTFATMYVTRIEDRFGNWLKYSYTGNKLSTISGSDGRVVSIVWRTDAPVIQSVTQQPGGSRARTWQYQYSNVSSAGAYLKAVVQPDGSQWSFTGSVVLDGAPSDATLNGMGSCSVRNSSGFLPQPDIYTSTITAPSGAIGTFDRKAIWHGRSYVYSECVDEMNGTPPHEAIPPIFGTYALVKRTISGPGMADSTWTYAYSTAIGSTLEDACVASGCPGTAYLDITDPDLNRTRHTYSTRAGSPSPKRWVPDEGRQTKTDFYQGASTPLRSVTFEYAAPDGGPYPALVGSSLVGGSSNTAKLETWTPLKKKQIAQQGETFTWAANSFDNFARPLSVNRGSSLGATRIEATAYHDDVADWVLGQVASITVNGTESARTDYDARDLPWKTWTFGKLQQTLAYHANGELATVTDGRGQITTLDGWWRGIPTLIRFPATPEAPAGASVSAEVDDYGWIISTTSETGATTRYEHDAMGRLARIVYPAEDQRSWHDTTMGFVRVGAMEYGIPAGHWRRTVANGYQRTVTYYDALWRPVLTREYDTSDEAATDRYVAMSYDAAGHQDYTAYAMAEAPTMTDGCWSNGGTQGLLPTDPGGPGDPGGGGDTGGGDTGGGDTGGGGTGGDGTGGGSTGSTGGPAISSLPGVHTTYDALGRVTRVEQDSELGLLTTATQYLSGFQRRTIDPRNNSTTEQFVAYDQPDFEQPTQIDAPEATRTAIDRDIFGKPTAIVRGVAP